MELIPYLDLKAQYLSIKTEIDAAIKNIVESCQFILGDEVKHFEEEFSSYCQSHYGIAVNSGTSALHLALLALGIGPGDEVITVPFTFIATVSAIAYTGARPVFVDIDPETFTIAAEQIEKVITKKTKAIMPVHLYGQMADMSAILDIARKYKLYVIEDAAQAHGAEYKGQRAGSRGDLGCFSFYPGKNLGAYGEGGMVVTSNPEYARTIRMLRDWGQEKKHNHELRGFNYRMEGIQGAVLRVKLRHLEKWTEARRACAAYYNELFQGSGIRTPVEKKHCRHVYHIYALKTPQREQVQKKLDDLHIQSGIHYPVPVHLQPAFQDLGYHKGSFPNSEAAANEELSLPMFAELKREQQQRVVKAILSV